MFKKFSIVMVFVLSILFIFSPVTNAQNTTNEPNINITISPQDPMPGELVTFKAQSFEANLDLAVITWEFGEEKKSGLGEKEFVVRAPNTEEGVISVSAKLILSGGIEVNKKSLIFVTSHDVLWEAVNSTTIPFYKGKKIPIRENSLRVAVISPNLNKNETSFVWARNNKSFETKSSTKDFIDFTNTEINNKEEVSVNITNKNTSAVRTLSIPFASRKVLFYEFNPVFGLNLGNALKDKVSSYENITNILAVPLGMNKNLTPRTIWKISGEEVYDLEKSNLISFVNPEEQGIVSIYLELENIKNLYQDFTTTLNLRF